MLAAGVVRAGDTWRAQDSAMQVSTERGVPAAALMPGPACYRLSRRFPEASRKLTD